MFVHSLVKVDHGSKLGWLAPTELDSEANQYIGFAIPKDATGELAEEYECDVVTATKKGRKVEAFRLSRSGSDSFVLDLPKGIRTWFHIRPVGNVQKGLPYLGALQHPDFAFPLVEIEPEDVAQLDELFVSQGLFLVGCDPEKHYTAARRARSATAGRKVTPRSSRATSPARPKRRRGRT
jgi:hypothetical protein